MYKLADDLNISRENVRIAPDFKFELTRDKYFYKQTTWDAVNEMVNSYNDLLIQKYGKNTWCQHHYCENGVRSADG